MPWIQYTNANGVQQATVCTKADDTELVSLGRAQIEVPPEITGDLSHYNVDLSQNPPVLVLADSPPDSPS